MKGKKKFIAIILAALMIFTAIPMTAFAQTYIYTIESGVTKTINFNPNNEYRFSFTPTQDGTYIFESGGTADTYAYLYDEDDYLVAESDDISSMDYNFRIEYDCYAGDTYTLVCDNSRNTNTRSVTISVKKAGEFSEINEYIEGNATIPISLSRYGQYVVEFEPTVPGVYALSSSGSVDPKIEIYTADHTLIDSNDDYDYANGELNFYLESRFAPSRTYYLVMTLYDDSYGDFDFYVNRMLDFDSVIYPDDDEMEVSLSNRYDIVALKFTPDRSGFYTLSSHAQGDADPAVELYYYDIFDDERLDYADDIDGADNRNFSLEAYFEKDVEYLFIIHCFNDDAITFDVDLASEATDVTYTYKTYDNLEITENTNGRFKYDSHGNQYYHYDYDIAHDDAYIVARYANGSTDYYYGIGDEFMNGDGDILEANLSWADEVYQYDTHWYANNTYGYEVYVDGEYIGTGYVDIIANSSTPCSHNYVLKNTKSATCTADGSKYYECTNCGKTYSETIEALGHNYQPTITTVASCTTPGVKTYTCTRCRDSYIEIIPAIGHNYSVSVTAPTCTQAGYTIKTCTRCSESITEEIPATGHSYETTVTAPTCTQRGFTTSTCKTCGDKTISNYTAALGHDYSIVEETTPATCTSSGVRTKTCTRCARTTTETIPSPGHKWDAGTVTTAATCTQQGIMTYRCSVCMNTKTSSIPQLNHSYTENVVAPTCTEKGYTTYTCSRCGDSYKSSEKGALGHNYIASKVEPTCTTKGYTSYTCSRCGYSYIGNETPVKAHDWGSRAVFTPATCINEGEAVYTCSVCHERKTEVIPATGHSFQNVTEKATLSHDGAKYSQCSICGFISEESKLIIGQIKSVSVSPTTFVYNGHANKPKITVKDDFGDVITPTSYTVKYSGAGTSVGRYLVTVTFKGNYEGTYEKTFDVKPKATTLTSAKSSKKGKLNIVWKKVPQATGYELQTSTTSNFKKHSSDKIASKYTKAAKSLKSKKKYYVRMRTYTTVTYNGKRITLYSDWSKTKTVKIK